MDANQGDESGEMYSPNEHGEYMPMDGVPGFSVQGLSDVLSDLGSKDTIVELPAEEMALQLEATMEDHPGYPHPSAFLWNMGMIMHVLKNDLSLRDLKHVQVEGPGTAYLFFFDKQCCHGLSPDATELLCTYLPGAFLEWISHSAHFTAIALPLSEE